MTPSPRPGGLSHTAAPGGRLFCALLPLPELTPPGSPRAPPGAIFLKLFSAPIFVANFPKTFFRLKNRHSCARRRNVSKNRHSCAHAYRLIVVMLTAFSKNPTFFFIPSMKSLPCSLSSMAVSNAIATALIATIM